MAAPELSATPLLSIFGTDRSMPFPPFLGPPARLSPASAMAPMSTAAPTGGGAPLSQNLALTVKQQQETTWCWAAVGTSIAAFYTATSRWTQCLVANGALPRKDCFAGPPASSNPAGCNIP